MSRSASPPHAVLPARVTALKDPNAALQRRRSLPLRLAPAPSPRKRRKSDATPAEIPAKRIIRITRQSQPAPPATTAGGGLSDTDSEPLSDPPTESEDEGIGGGMLMARNLSMSTTSVSSSTTPAPAVVPRSRPTRASARIAIDRKPPARTSARIRQSLGAVSGLDSGHSAQVEEATTWVEPSASEAELISVHDAEAMGEGEECQVSQSRLA